MSLDVNISEPDEFNCSELHSCIDAVAKLKGLEDIKYHVDLLCGTGENYVSNVFRILIKDQSDKQFSFMIKTLINTARQDLFHELHKREVKVYEKIISKYEELQESLEAEQRVVFPKCEYTRAEKSKEVIILEDMRAKGYEIDTTLANYECLNYSQVSTTLKELAKFHALSFIYEKQDSETFTTVKSEFQDILFSEIFLSTSNNKLRSYFYESFGMSLNLVEDQEAKTKLEKIQHKLLELLKLYTRPRKNNVLCHGDCWINNILFKYEENKKAMVCFIDFQVMRYSSPLTDILYFIFICTDSAFRLTYFDNLMAVYYDSLKSFLNVFSIDVYSVYPKEDFDRDYNDLLPFGLLLAMVELRLVTTSPEDGAVAKGSNIIPGTGVFQDPDQMTYFKIRVNDVVNECVENGDLDRLVDKLNYL